MRAGVIGGGYWGSKHVRVLHSLPEVDEVVLVDPRQPVRRALAAAFPGLEVHASLDDALPRIDAAVVATPAASHAGLARRCLDAGVHVLVEKPLATTVADARMLVVRAQAAGLVLMVGHTFEYSPAVARLRELVQGGELGDVYFLDAARLNLGLYQPDVNVVWDLAPHDVSIANHVLGARPDVVQAWGSSNAHAFLEDVAYVRLDYRSIGVTAQLHLSWLEPEKVRRTTVVGSRRMAVYNDLHAEAPLRLYDRGLDLRDGHPTDGTDVTYRHGGVVAPAVALDREPLVEEDRHFLECVRVGATPRSDGRSGLAVVEVLAAAETSLREQRPVGLEPDVRSVLAPTGT